MPDAAVVLLLGPSGSGKSTLLDILGALDSPAGGRLFFRETDLPHATDRALTRYRRDHVGFVFPFYNLMPALTARENVALVTEPAAFIRLTEEISGISEGDRLVAWPDRG